MIKNHPHWNDDDWDAISDFAQPPVDELNQEDSELSKLGSGVLKDTRPDQALLLGYEGVSVSLGKGETPLGDLATRIAKNTQGIQENKGTLGDHRNTLDGQSRTIDGHRGRLDGHDTYLGGHDTRLNGHDQEIGYIKNSLIGGLLKTVGELGKKVVDFIAEVTTQITQLFKGQEILTQSIDAERRARELEINRQAFALARDIDDAQYYAVGYLATDMPSVGGTPTRHADLDWRHLPLTIGFAKGCAGVGNGIRIDKPGFWRITSKILFGGGQAESDWIQEAYVMVVKPGGSFDAGPRGEGGKRDPNNGNKWEGFFGNSPWRRPERPKWGDVNPGNSPYNFANIEHIVAASFVRHYASKISFGVTGQITGNNRYNMDITLTDSFCINIPSPGYTVYVIFRGAGVRAGAGSTVVSMDMIDTSIFEKVKERIPNE